ncbi:hypothetical protein Q7C36_014527 [Tachysurus vachellii]|uniref:Uncharacterized protein n=1 Tax=Tachysurus vachellii TaxID=175792 RepID=A0AA88MJ90_TACVA|nr:hypothetical protein Q7C36_014527 [Tachysurus vachellii]
MNLCTLEWKNSSEPGVQWGSLEFFHSNVHRIELDRIKEGGTDYSRSLRFYKQILECRENNEMLQCVDVYKLEWNRRAVRNT